MPNQIKQLPLEARLQNIRKRLRLIRQKAAALKQRQIQKKDEDKITETRRKLGLK